MLSLCQRHKGCPNINKIKIECIWGGIVYHAFQNTNTQQCQLSIKASAASVCTTITLVYTTRFNFLSNKTNNHHITHQLVYIQSLFNFICLLFAFQPCLYFSLCLNYVSSNRLSSACLIMWRTLLQCHWLFVSVTATAVLMVFSYWHRVLSSLLIFFMK